MEHREKRPKTGASGGSAAADHGSDRRDKQAPYIPLIYLTVLSSKLMAMAMSDVLPETDLSTYYDERMMAAMSEHMTEALDRIVAMQNGEEDAQMPVS